MFNILVVSISVWYLVLGGARSESGKVVIPSPFMDKSECLSAGKEQATTPEDAKYETSYFYVCVEGRLYD